jgi:hypothetical protein
MMHDDDLGPVDFNVAKRIFETIAEPDELEVEETRRIGDYQLIRPLGAGGGGTVYLARRVDGQRQVALKLQKRPLGNEEMTQRAWRELELLRRLQCPEIPKLHDFGEHDGCLYIVYDLIEGLPLDQYAAKHEGDLRAKVRLLTKVARSLQNLHELGVIHRDIKPANILVDNQRNVFFVDFGLATQITFEHEATLTAEGQPLGTPAFMAPELARGEHRMVSTRSDVCSLGATAYRILTGRTPHDVDAPFHEAVRRVGQEPPRDPRALDKAIPVPLAGVLLKAVSRDPQSRYATALDLAEDLERWLDRKPVKAIRQRWPQQAAMAIGRHRVASVLITLLVIAVGGALYMAGVAQSQGRLAADRQALLDDQRAFTFNTIKTITQSMEVEEYARAHKLITLLSGMSGDSDDAALAVEGKRDELTIQLLEEIYEVDLDPDAPETKALLEAIRLVAQERLEAATDAFGGYDPVVKAVLQEAKKIACSMETLCQELPLSAAERAILIAQMRAVETDFCTILDPGGAPCYDPADLAIAGGGNAPPAGDLDVLTHSLKEEACEALDRYCDLAAVPSIEAARTAMHHLPEIRSLLP